jgi:hypothetical protein
VAPTHGSDFPVARGPILAVAFGFATAAFAGEVIEHERGRVVYAARCSGQYAFGYQDGGKLSQPCVDSSEAVTLGELVATARRSDCRNALRVLHGTVEDGVLYATEIEEVIGCGAHR